MSAVLVYCKWTLNQDDDDDDDELANHGACRPYALAAAGGYLLRRLVLTLWV